MTKTNKEIFNEYFHNLCKEYDISCKDNEDFSIATMIQTDAESILTLMDLARTEGKKEK